MKRVKIWLSSVCDKISYLTGFKTAREITPSANWAGRVKIEHMDRKTFQKKTDLFSFQIIRDFMMYLQFSKYLNL